MASQEKQARAAQAGTPALRDLAPPDRDRLLDWRNRPEVARFMYSDQVIDAAEHAAWFAGLAGDETRRYWVVELDGAPVGLANLTGIDRRNGRCSWAFYLADPAVRGRGLGLWVECAVLAYVFEALELDKLSCEVLAVNKAVCRLHESVGFQREGLLRRHIRKADGWHDVVLYGLLKEDWPACRARLRTKLADKGLLPPSA